MKIIFDASNLRAGGGIIHIQNLLQFADPEKHQFKKIIVYGGQNPLEKLLSNNFLDLREIPVLNKSFLHRFKWQQSQLGQLAEQEKAMLFVAGGLYLLEKRPFVSMFQNMQIFETPEKNREGLSKEWLRLHLLKLGQTQTFKNCSGLICLSNYARSYINQFYPKLLKNKEVRIIPHGITQVKHKKKYRFNQKIKLLYVSTVKQYKHQWHLIDAVALLKKQGFSLELHLIGSGDGPAIKRMRRAIQDKCFLGEFVYYHGHLSHSETLDWYNKADLFAFASTCETFGISLLEAMSAGLPIACSDRGPMPEILRDAGVYFNPENPSSIAASLKLLLQDESLRETLGRKALSLSQAFSWERCAHETFSFISSIGKRHSL